MSTDELHVVEHRRTIDDFSRCARAVGQDGGMKATKPLEDLVALAVRTGNVPSRTSTRELRKWILRFGSETDDNRAAAKRISAQGRRWLVGTGNSKVALSDVVHALEDMDDVVQRVAVKLGVAGTDAAAALRFLTLLGCALDDAAAPTKTHS